MYEYEAKYYPKEKVFMLVHHPYKGIKKDDDKEVHQYGYETIYDGRSESLRKEIDSDWLGDEYLANKIEFNWKGNKDKIKRVLFRLIFNKTDRFIKADPTV